MMGECSLLEGMIFNKVMILKANVHFCLNHKQEIEPGVYRSIHSKMYFSGNSFNQLDFLSENENLSKFRQSW